MHQIVYAAEIIAFAMTLGTILAIIAMSTVVGNSQDATLVGHQRRFASAISRYATVPGMLLLLVVAVASFAIERDAWAGAEIVIAALLVANTLFGVVPLLSRTTRAVDAVAPGAALPTDYPRLKGREDAHGGVNLLLLVALLVVTALASPV
jgi:hypothetical protein